ncbi:hypothetical protein LZD49_01520 [Dyadobacter sp. CY261]|uniref:hypothetical protein n=1 Tax=Dyadobacter sp. CY261 TaxID=2907203 RepID=UPI001F259D4E|nr:hypothetical protein [Dyadobacter sp. CY261]MCF0069130.1 hypothetical protein [Dyadobacter sp. CY261]
MKHQQIKAMAGVQYSIISEKMVWIWYFDEFGGKHLKELLADDAAAFVKRARMQKEQESDVVGMDFLTAYKTAN